MRERELQISCFTAGGQLILSCLFAFLLLSGCSTTPNTATNESRNVDRRQPSNSGFHEVRKGDTLYAVSWRIGVDYKTLARWNGLAAPYTIYPGQKLRLTPPAVRKTASASNEKPASASKPKPAKKTTPPPSVKGKETSAVPKKTTVSPKKKTTPPNNTRLRWTWPTKGKVVGTYSRGDSSRAGIKIAGRRGQGIKAAEAGQVVYVGSGLVGYGRLIIVKHNNKYLSAYGHNDRLLIKEGDVVKKGDHIADMGVAHSGKAMLHFEIREFGKPVNPISYLP